MQITLYLRSYPVAGAPVAVSFSPDVATQRHTYVAAGREYEAERREVQVVVPDDAKLDLLKKLLGWDGDNGPVKSTAKDVFNLAEARTSGFRLAS